MGVDKGEDLFPSTFGCEPWLMQLHGRRKNEQEFMNPYNHCIEKRKIPQLQGKVCLGCFEDWLLLADMKTKATFFLHRTLDPKLTVHLPSLCGESFEELGGCVLSSSPTSRKCMVTFVGRRRNVILYCKPKEANWTKVSLQIDLGGCLNGKVVRFKGKIYALNGILAHQAVVVINEESLLNGECRWKILEMPTPSAGWYRRYLVASADGIFLVSVALSLYQGIPTHYTVHNLDTSCLSWKRVESINGHAFFLGDIHSSVLSATQAGIQRDCIFVVNPNYGIFPVQGIYRICMMDQTVVLSLLLNGRKDKFLDFLCWAMPTRSRRSKREPSSFSHFLHTNKCDAIIVHKEVKKEEKCEIDISRPWADMPIELVQLLLPRLWLVDCLRLPSVCKAWSSLSNPIQEAKVYPWLMYPVKDSSLWRLFDPVYEKEYSIDMTWLGFSNDLTFHYSKDGWVLVSKEDNSLLLLNPLTRESISLPHLDANCQFNSLVFSSAPTSPDCVVLLFTDLEVRGISTWRPGEGEWSKIDFVNEDIVFHMPCSPVFYCGKFYCYGVRGELFAFDPKNKTWEVLQMQAPIKIQPYRRRIMECYLVESKGDLITVFRGRTTGPIRIFKLDQLNMIWSELDGTGDITLFIDRRTSLARPCPEKWCHKLIYLSGFTDDRCKNSAYYSFDTKNYYPDIYYLLKQPLNCTWIEPSLTAQ